MQNVVKCITFSYFLGIGRQTPSSFLLSPDLKEIRAIFITLPGVGTSTAQDTTSVEYSSSSASPPPDTGSYFPTEIGPD